MRTLAQLFVLYAGLCCVLGIVLSIAVGAYWFTAICVALLVGGVWYWKPRREEAPRRTTRGS